MDELQFHNLMNRILHYLYLYRYSALLLITAFTTMIFVFNSFYVSTAVIPLSSFEMGNAYREIEADVSSKTSNVIAIDRASISGNTLEEACKISSDTENLKRNNNASNENTNVNHFEIFNHTKLTLEEEEKEKEEFEKDFPLLPIPFPSNRGTLFFMHIPKSGGTSMWSLLNKIIEKKNSMKKQNNNLSSKEANKKNRSNNNDVMICSRVDYLWLRVATPVEDLMKRLQCCHILTGHIDVSIEDLFARECNINSTEENGIQNNNNNRNVDRFFATMTILREPISRFISSFFFYNQWVGRRKFTIWTYLNWTIMHQLDNLQTRMLSGNTTSSLYSKETRLAISSMNATSLLSLAKKNLRKMIVVGLTENFNDTVRFLDKGLGLDQNRQSSETNSKRVSFMNMLKVYNIQNYNATALLEENPGLKEAISSIHQLDQEIYAYAKRLFQWRKTKLSICNSEKK